MSVTDCKAAPVFAVLTISLSHRSFASPLSLVMSSQCDISLSAFGVIFFPLCLFSKLLSPSPLPNLLFVSRLLSTAELFTTRTSSCAIMSVAHCILIHMTSLTGMYGDGWCEQKRGVEMECVFTKTIFAMTYFS